MRYSKITILCFGFTILPVDPGFAFTRTVAMKDFKEEFRSGSKISGSEILGAAYYSENDKIDFRRIHFKATGVLKEPLKVVIQTIDGEYFATGTIPTSEVIEGWHLIEYDTSNVKRLKYSSTNQIAVSISTGGRILPIRWGVDSGTDEILVQINSQHSRAYFVERFNDAWRSVDCKDTSELSPIKFNKICKINLKRVYRENKSIDIRIESSSGYRDQPIEIRLED